MDEHTDDTGVPGEEGRMTGPLPNVGPYAIYRAGPCPYCRREVRMYGTLFSNVDDGELHTCASRWVDGMGIQRWYQDGDWYMIDPALASPPPATETPEQ